MKKVIRPLSVCLCLLMIFAMFAACGNNAQNKEPSDTVSKSSTTAATAAADTTTATDQTDVKSDPLGKYDSAVTLSAVRFLNSSYEFDPNDPNTKSISDNIWTKLYEEELNVTLNYLWTPNRDEYNTKWNTAIASRDIPDCAVIDSLIYKTLLEAGFVEDMTDYFNDYASDIYNQYIAEDGGITPSYMTINGRLYGLPITGSQPDGSDFLFIRKDWLDKVNMPVPETIDELIDTAKAFTDAKLGGDDTYGLCTSKTIYGGHADMVGFFNGYGAFYDIWVEDGSGNIVYATIQDNMKAPLIKLQQMYKDGLLSQDFAVKDTAKAMEDISSGKVGIVYGVFWTPLLNIMANLTNDKDAEWKVIMPPTSDGSAYKAQGSASPLEYLFVNKGCKNPEAVVKLVNLTLHVQNNQDEYSDLHFLEESGINTWRYNFVPDIARPWKNLEAHEAVAAALKSGDTSTLNDEQLFYYDKAKETETLERGTSEYALSEAYNLVFGANSTYKLIGELKNSGRIVVDTNQALPTETQTSNGETIKTSLDAAILRVIMGEDISVFDNAVKAWKSGGGDLITQEVNELYAGNR